MGNRNVRAFTAKVITHNKMYQIGGRGETPISMSISQTQPAPVAARAVFPVVAAISVIHFLNDTMQIVVPAVLPYVRESLVLTFTQVGFVLFMLNMTSSVLQPIVGLYSDRHPSPYMLPFGMCLSLLGMIGVALSPSYGWLLLSVILIGLGSACFHPEGSKVVHLAAGKRRGLAQSIYQVGGNTGSSTQSLLTRYIFLPFGQIAALWFTLVAGLAIVVSWFVSRWYKANLHVRQRTAVKPKEASPAKAKSETRSIALKVVLLGMGILMLQMIARSTYITMLQNYYQYYYAEVYDTTLLAAQLPLFLFGLTGVLGTLAGGPLADRFGPKKVIFISLTGAAPFAMLLPFVGKLWVIPLLAVIGFIMSLGFAVIVVYAQMIMPGHIGMASGLTVGLAFGLGAIGAVGIGYFIDLFSLRPVVIFGSFLPLFGLFALKLPDVER